MLDQAKRKLKMLIYDDSGVAMAYTILVFLCFFLFCASVAAMTENIRQKMELQNACDAAAYSGAVVQADMLSRIAVLNRALSWTYAQTNKRQMDYIVDKWATKIYSEYVEYRNKAENYYYKRGYCTTNNTNGGYCPCGHFARTWIAGTDKNGWSAAKISLNEQKISASTIKGMRGQGTGESTNIDYGKNNISILNKELLWIKQNLNTLIGKAVSHSISHSITIQTVSWKYFTDNAWMKTGAASYIIREHDEETFLNFSDNKIDNCYEAGFKTSNRNGWWVDKTTSDENNKDNSDDDKYGIYREYVQIENGALTAYTSYYTTRHKHNEDGICYVSSSKSDFTTLTGEEVRDGYFTGAKARPQKLASSFFGKAGSIVVAAKRPLTNPFSWMGDESTTRGLYAAFSPDRKNNGNNDMWAVSAARAGVRLEKNPDGHYVVQYPGEKVSGYTNDVWNLCEEDWDAVLIPVSRAWNETDTGKWVDKTDEEDHVINTAEELLKDVKNQLNVETDYKENIDKWLVH